MASAASVYGDELIACIKAQQVAQELRWAEEDRLRAERAEQLTVVLNNAAPGIVAFVLEAVKDPKLTWRNLKKLVRDKLSAMTPSALSMDHAAQNAFWTATYLLFVLKTYTPEAQTDPGAAALGSLDLFGRQMNMMAPANGGSVVDAVFAKAERKAATR